MNRLLLKAQIRKTVQIRKKAQIRKMLRS